MNLIKKIIKRIGFKRDYLSTNLLILLSLILLSSLITMLFAIFVLQGILNNTYTGQRITQERFYFWMEKVEEYPNSPDVLYNAASAAVLVGKKETALKLLQKSLRQDPLFKDAKVLRDSIIAESK